MAEPAPFDLKQHEVAMAMHGHPRSLSAKLKLIWELTERMLRLAEEQQKVLIRKAWGVHEAEAFETNSLDVRAELAARHRLVGRAPSEPLVDGYFRALDGRRHIQKEFHDVLQRAVAAASQAKTYDRSGFGHPVWHANSFELEGYLNAVVPCFFSLQLWCYHLVRMLESPEGVPRDPLTRRRRAASGGAASNHGEALLKDLIIDCLNSIEAKRELLSIEQFFNDHYGEFAAALKDYRSRIGSTWNGREVTYGQTLAADGVKKKLREWAKEDKVFRDKLSAHCKLSQRGKKRDTPAEE